MLAIGRALMTNPRCWCWTRPPRAWRRSSVPRSGRARGAESEGLSQIVIDKNVGALLEFADRHFVLEKGWVVWQGSSAALRGAPHVIEQYLGV